MSTPIADAFPSPTIFGMDSVVGANHTDILFAIIETWKNVGAGNIWTTTLVFGSIPLLLGMMVYIRTQKTFPAVYTSMLGVLIVNALELYYYGRLNTLMVGFITVTNFIALIFSLVFLFSKTDKE